MKSKQLALLLAIAALLGGAVWYLLKNNKDSWSGSGGGAGGKVIEFPINDVERLSIQSSAGTVTLTKRNDMWTVVERADYPANFEDVSNLLRKLEDLKTVQVVKVGPSQFARLELVEPAATSAPPTPGTPGAPAATGAGTKVSLVGKEGKSLGGVIIGKRYMKKADDGMGGGDFAAGRYVAPLGGSAVSLVSDSFEEVVPKPETWLQHDFIKVNMPSSVTLAGATDAQKWKLTRENSAATEWKLAGAKDDEKVDAGKTSPFGTLLANAAFTDVLAPEAKPADTGLDKPVVLTLDTFEDFTYVLSIGKLTGDNYPVRLEVSSHPPKERAPGKDEKPEDKTKLDQEFTATQKRLAEKLAAEKRFEGRVYLIAKATIEQLVKDRAGLLAEKPAPTPPGAPAPGAGGPGIGAPGAVIGAPGPRPGGPALPPGHVPIEPPHAPVTATTPPVSVPGIVVPPKPEPKPEVPKPEPKPEVPKPEVPKPEVPKPEAPKPEAPKPEAPKPEAPKPEAPKPEAPKPEAPKPEVPKPEAPKPEAPKPEAPKPEAPKL